MHQETVAGAFQYAALHIRRNELQYHDSFIAAEESLKHVKPLLTG